MIFLPSSAMCPSVPRPGCLTPLEHLHRQARQGRQLALPKGRDAVVIGGRLAGQHPVRNILVGGALDPPRARLPATPRIQQQPDHHHRMIRRLGAPISAFVHLHDLGEVQRVEDIQHQPRPVPFGNPLAHLGRQQQSLISVGCAEGLPHPPPLHCAAPLRGSFLLTHGRHSGVSPAGS